MPGDGQGPIQRVIPGAAQLDIHTGEITLDEHWGGWCPTIIRPDNAGVGHRGPIDVAAAIMEHDLGVRMIAKRWEAGDHGFKGPDRIEERRRPESRNHAHWHSRGVLGVRLAVYQPEPATREYDARQRRGQGLRIRLKVGRREFGRYDTLIVDLLDRAAPLGNPDCVAVKGHRCWRV